MRIETKKSKDNAFSNAVLLEEKINVDTTKRESLRQIYLQNIFNAHVCAFLY